MKNNEIEVKDLFAGFDYADDKNHLCITFSFNGSETEKILKNRIALGTICNIKILKNKFKQEGLNK